MLRFAALVLGRKNDFREINFLYDGHSKVCREAPAPVCTYAIQPMYFADILSVSKSKIYLFFNQKYHIRAYIDKL